MPGCCSTRGPAPIGAAAAPGAQPQSEWLQQQGPSPNRRGCSSKAQLQSPAPRLRPGIMLLPHGRAWAPEPSIAARRHGYPGWGSHHLWEKRLKVTHVTLGAKKGHVISWQAGDGLQYPPRKFFCRTMFPRPPLMDDTARCYSIAAGPTRGTAAPLSQATCFSPRRPGRTTTMGTPAGVLMWGGGRLRLARAPDGPPFSAKRLLKW